LGALSNGILYGNILSLFYVSFLCDRIGRVRTIGVGATICTIGVVIQSASQNYTMLLVGRFVLGMGVCLSTTAAPMLIAETTYPSQRPYMTAMSQCLYGLGGIIAAWTTYGTNHWPTTSNWQWRLPLVLQLLFPLTQLAFLYFIPESPRWLVSRGKVDKAREFFLKHHGGGNEELAGPLIEYEMLEVTYALELETSGESTKWMDFVKTKGNRRRLFIILFMPVMTQLSGNAVLSYFLNLVLNAAGITSSNQQLIFNGGISIFNFGIGWVSISLVEYVGRRRMFLISTFGSMLVYIAFTITSAENAMTDFKSPQLAHAVVALIFLFYLTFTIGMLAITAVS
jgi:MFS family permease